MPERIRRQGGSIIMNLQDLTTLNTCFSSQNSDFSIYNLPFGILFSRWDAPKAGISYLGEQIVEFIALANLGFLDVNATYFRQSTLNDFISLWEEHYQKVPFRRSTIMVDNSPLKNHLNFLPQRDAKRHLPVAHWRLYDFYSSIEHATNVG